MKLWSHKILSDDRPHHFKVEVECFRNVLCAHHQGMLYWVKTLL
jgi:hypothetical protein